MTNTVLLLQPYKVNEMTFMELVQMVEEYAERYKCSIDDSIYDLEFDGPNGSTGPSSEDVERLQVYFG